MTLAINSIDAPAYAPNTRANQGDDAIIATALAILAARVRPGAVLDAPATVRNYLTLRAAKHTQQEVFTVLFLDAQHRLLGARDMFHGSLTQATVYPREIARVALELGAAAVILSHNHPSGDVEPSRADRALTDRLKQSLELVDVRVLDHVIVAGGASLSMAEQGMV